MGLWQGTVSGQVQVARPAGVPPPITGRVVAQSLSCCRLVLRIPSVFSPLKAVCVPSRSLTRRAPQATLRSSSASRFWQGPASTTRGDPSLLHDSLRDLADLPRGLPLLDELSAIQDHPGSSGGGSSSNGSSRSSKNGAFHRESDENENKLSAEVYEGIRNAASKDFQGKGEIHSAGGDGRAVEERLLSDFRAEKSRRKEGKKVGKKSSQSTRTTGARTGELGPKSSQRELSPPLPAVDLNSTRHESSSAPALSPPHSEASAPSQLQQQYAQTLPSRQFPRSDLPPRSLWPRGNFTSSGTSNSLVGSSMGEVPCPVCSGRGYQRCPCTTFNSPEPAASGACSQCSGMKRTPCRCCEGRRVILATQQDLTSLMREPLPSNNAGDSASPAHRRARWLARKDLLVETMVEKEMERRKGQAQQAARSHSGHVLQAGERAEEGNDGPGGSSRNVSEGLQGGAGEGEGAEGAVGSGADAFGSALDSAVKSGVARQRSRARAKRGRKRPLTAEDQEKMTAAKREMREVFSLLARRRFADPELRERSMAAMRKGYKEKNAPQLISAGLKAYYASQENRKKKSELMTGRVFRCKGCGQEGHRQNFCPALGYVKRSRPGRKVKALDGEGRGKGGSGVDNKPGGARSGAGKATGDVAAGHVQDTMSAPELMGSAPSLESPPEAHLLQRTRSSPELVFSVSSLESPAPELKASSSREQAPSVPVLRVLPDCTAGPVQAVSLQEGPLVPLRRTASETEMVRSANSAGKGTLRWGKGIRCCGVCGDRGHNRRTCPLKHALEKPSVESSGAEASSLATAVGAIAAKEGPPSLSFAV